MAIGECYAGLDTPGAEVSGMNGFSGVMFGESPFDVFREACVEAVQIRLRGRGQSSTQDGSVRIVRVACANSCTQPLF